MTKPPSPWRPLAINRFLLGVCHFPEQEAPEFLEPDARLMAEAGVETVRMGEFAWSIFEPREGEYDFRLFDEAIATLGTYGIDTILCTPTATPPRWLTHAHPEVLRVDATGSSMRHGSRQHVDLVHPLFREHSRKITRALVEHYRDNPHVIGWQTDNELNTHFSETHSEAAQVAFRDWLRVRYETIDALNDAWGTIFWNRQYCAFDQIETPQNNRPASADPSHLLDYRRFLADSTRDFQFDQVEILRSGNPDWFIFHNIGRLNDTDLRAFGNDLDFLGTDLYPGLRDEFMKVGLGYAQAFQLDLFRGWTGNFIVPEMQAGGGAHPNFALPAPEPGEMKRFAMSAIARGADGIIWFRWTSARFGAEAYWMGVLDHDRVPRRRFEEFKTAIAEIKNIRDKVLGTSVEAQVVILSNDWDNEIAHSTFSLGLPSLPELALPLHHHCYLKNIPCGFAAPQDDLCAARVVFVPHLPIWKDEWTRSLEQFAEAGGIVVVGARTATRDNRNHLTTDTAPGPLARLCGVEVSEFGRLPALGAASVLAGPVFQVENVQSGRKAESARREHTLQIGGTTVPAALGYEILEPSEGVEIVGTWATRWLDGKPAVTRRRIGSGTVIYCGTFLTHPLIGPLFEPLFAEAKIRSPEGLPPGVETSVRSSKDGRYRFLQNTGDREVQFQYGDLAIAIAPFGSQLIEEQ